MMERPALPEKKVREWANELAYQIACEKLAAVPDIEARCRQSDAVYLPDRRLITLTYLNRAYEVSYPDGEVSAAGSREPVPIRDKILILHYLTNAGGQPPTGKTITYKELHDGINYYPTFFIRAIKPIMENFGRRPQLLAEIAQQLGGAPADFGDTAVAIPAFPRVPLIVVLWQGDSEFPPDGNILFDSTISDYLPTEDITVLCEAVAWKLVGLLKGR